MTKGVMNAELPIAAGKMLAAVGVGKAPRLKGSVDTGS